MQHERKQPRRTQCESCATTRCDTTDSTCAVKNELPLTRSMRAPSSAPATCWCASGLPPLDIEGALWVAALDRVPIEERIEWVAKIMARVDEINAARAVYDGDPPGAGWQE